ncbi:MAG: hypothetical protein ABI611_10635, partial [Solirubrobacteraceae bacterium]
MARVLPFGIVQRVLLGEDRVRDRHLADVMQLGGTAQILELLRWQRQPLADRDSQLHDPPHVILEGWVALRQRAREHVAGLAAGRGAAAVLLHVHALVRKVRRPLGVSRLGGQRHPPEGAGDGEALASLTERGRGRRQQPVLLGRPGVGEHHELVTADAIRGAAGVHRLLERLAHPDQQGVAGRVPVGVVVGLEPVEVEDRQASGTLCRGLRGHALEVARQGAAVAEPGERVGGGLLAAGREHPEVVPEGEREP